MINKYFILILIAVFCKIFCSCGNRNDYYHNKYYCDLKNKIEQDLDVSAFDELELNVYYDDSKEEYRDVIRYAKIITEKKDPMYGENVFELYEMSGLLSKPLHLDTALIYLKKSAKAGNQYAAYKLGRMYRDGEYVKLNLDNACYYFKLAPDFKDSSLSIY